MADVHNASYYSKCMVGGILSCGITHTAICPLDIIKCRKQVRYIARINPLLRSTPTCTRVSWMDSGPFMPQKE